MNTRLVLAATVALESLDLSLMSCGCEKAKVNSNVYGESITVGGEKSRKASGPTREAASSLPSRWVRFLASALRLVGLRLFPAASVGAMRMRRYRLAG